MIIRKTKNENKTCVSPEYDMRMIEKSVGSMSGVREEDDRTISQEQGRRITRGKPVRSTYNSSIERGRKVLIGA